MKVLSVTTNAAAGIQKNTCLPPLLANSLDLLALEAMGGWLGSQVKQAILVLGLLAPMLPHSRPAGPPDWLLARLMTKARVQVTLAQYFAGTCGRVAVYTCSLVHQRQLRSSTLETASSMEARPEKNALESVFRREPRTLILPFSSRAIR